MPRIPPLLPLLLLLVLLFQCALADHLVTVVATDARSGISYNTTSGSSTVTDGTGQTSSQEPSWSPNPMDSKCPNQMITYRIGDFMSFTFNGTSVRVRGTIGLKGGLIAFAIDGVTDPKPVNRTSDAVQCPWILWQKQNLPLGRHTVVATLIEDANEPYQPGMTPLLSVEDIQYMAPGDAPGMNKALVFFIVVLVLSIVGAGIWFLIKRLRNRRHSYAPAGAFPSSDTPASRVQRWFTSKFRGGLAPRRQNTSRPIDPETLIVRHQLHDDGYDASSNKPSTPKYDDDEFSALVKPKRISGAPTVSSTRLDEEPDDPFDDDASTTKYADSVPKRVRPESFQMSDWGSSKDSSYGHKY